MKMKLLLTMTLGCIAILSFLVKLGIGVVFMSEVPNRR